MPVAPRFRPVVLLLAITAAALSSVACRAEPDATAPARGRVATSAQAAARLPGFLEPDERPNSVALVPPPPRDGSGEHAADVAVYRSMRALRDTPRWRLAIADANVGFPRAADTFACALGMAITESETPNLYRLLQRTLIDAGQSTSAAKDRYQRPRPFAVYGEPTCVPDDDEALRKSGAYPSGHASAGWAWALILAEIAPDRSEQLLRRGYEFGVSRVVCGVHWQSDIETGRTVGAATYARLHADPEFAAQLALARQEVMRARSARKGADLDCTAETRALAATAPR